MTVGERTALRANVWPGAVGFGGEGSEGGGAGAAMQSDVAYQGGGDARARARVCVCVCGARWVAAGGEALFVLVRVVGGSRSGVLLLRALLRARARLVLV